MGSVKPKILIVDQERESLDAVFNLLSPKYDIVTALSGKHALEIVGSIENITCVITENNLSDFSGINLLTKISDLVPETVRIILSAYLDKNILLDAINLARVYFYIVKPFNPSVLIKKIDEAVTQYDTIRKEREIILKLEKQNRELIQRFEKRKDDRKELMDKENLKAMEKFSLNFLRDCTSSLNNIKGFAKIIKNKYGTMDPRIMKYADMILNGANKILDHTQELKDLGEREFSLKCERVDACDLILDLYQQIVFDIKKKDIKLITDIKFDGEIFIDRVRITRALIKVFLNSINSAPHGGVIVWGVTKEDGKILFSFSDNGEKFSANELENAFEPINIPARFVAGLYSAKRIIKSHKGDLTIVNNEPNGKTFLASIPLEG